MYFSDGQFLYPRIELKLNYLIGRNDTTTLMRQEVSFTALDRYWPSHHRVFFGTLEETPT
jgi:hypothetical protein